jgi:hypothetical protein
MSVSKIVAAAASGVGGAGLDVDEVFATHLYVGTGDSTQKTIVNGVDLAGEGGLVWTKSRTNTQSNTLGDSESGLQYYLHTNTTVDHTDATTGYYNSFNSNGYLIGNSNFTTNELNANGQDFVSWTWRKAPKFFDIQTWTGNGASDRAIPHNLTSTPGMIIVKRISGGDEDWGVWHTSVHSNTSKVMYLNSPAGLVTSTHIFGATNPTDSNFYVGDHPISNNNGDGYVAYIFAHNNGDGDFGPDADQDIIKCGTYTTDGSANATIDLGFEPQWLLRKRSDGSENWTIYDAMRGLTTGDDDALVPNDSLAEAVNGNQYNLTPTGFVAKEHSANRPYIYVAIRRGSLFTPEDADDVFSIDSWGGGPPAHETSGHIVDLGIQKNVTGNSSWAVNDRLMGPKKINTDQTQAEGNSSNAKFDYQNGWWASSASLTNYTGYMWKRAPGFFDIVHYTGNGVQGRNINHNLGVAPDMMWIKNRDATTDWAVYFSGLTHLSVFGSDPDGYGDNPIRLELNTVEQAQFSSSGVWDHTHPTNSVFRVGDTGATNGNNQQLVAYLFGSIDGVSKAGAVVHTTGTRTHVDCTFSAGARFVMYKYVNAQTQLGVNDPSNWHVFDTVRGIVGGIDSRLSINEVDSEITTGNDYIDPSNVGFSIPSAHPTGTYVFYAIA